MEVSSAASVAADRVWHYSDMVHTPQTQSATDSQRLHFQRGAPCSSTDTQPCWRILGGPEGGGGGWKVWPGVRRGQIFLPGENCFPSMRVYSCLEFYGDFKHA